MLRLRLPATYVVAIKLRRSTLIKDTPGGEECKSWHKTQDIDGDSSEHGTTMVFSETEIRAMARKWASATVLKAVFKLCFIVLFFQWLAFAEWVIASSITYRSPIAHLEPYFMFLLGAQVVALVLYFRKPWVAVIVAWLSVAVILARAIPWGTPEWASALRQFRFEIVFLVLAHAGYAVFLRMNRAEREEIEEVVGPQPGSGDAQS